MKLRTSRTVEPRRLKADEVIRMESSAERPKVEMKKILEPYLSQLIGEANLDSPDEAKQKEAAHGLVYLALLFPEKALATSKLKQLLETELTSDRTDYALGFNLAQLFPRKELRQAQFPEEDIQNIEAGIYPTSSRLHLFLMVWFPEQRNRWEKLLEQQIEKEVGELTRPLEPGRTQRVWKEEITLLNAAYVILVNPEYKLVLQQAMEKRMGWSEHAVESTKNGILQHVPLSRITQIAFAVEVVFGDTIQGIDRKGHLVYTHKTPNITRPLPERVLT